MHLALVKSMLSDAGMCCDGQNMKNTRDIDFVTFEIWVLVLAALLLALMCIEWISVWRIPLLNDQRYWSKTFEWNACMRLELTDARKCKADVSCLCQYIILNHATQHRFWILFLVIFYIIIVCLWQIIPPDLIQTYISLICYTLLQKTDMLL